MRTIVMLAVLVLALALSGCAAMTAAAPAAPPAFPIGKLTLQSDKTRTLQFNKDGTFAALASDMRLVGGTYTVQGDTYTEISDDQGCPSPRHYKFTITGTSLVFHPVEDPKTDPCDGRTSDFGETATWVISSPASAGARVPLIHQGVADLKQIDSAQPAGR
jgi:hypothetical protein